MDIYEARAIASKVTRLGYVAEIASKAYPTRERYVIVRAHGQIVTELHYESDADSFFAGESK